MPLDRYHICLFYWVPRFLVVPLARDVGALEEAEWCGQEDGDDLWLVTVPTFTRNLDWHDAVIRLQRRDGEWDASATWAYINEDDFSDDDEMPPPIPSSMTDYMNSLLEAAATDLVSWMAFAWMAHLIFVTGNCHRLGNTK
jgi:hypothetical protein